MKLILPPRPQGIPPELETRRLTVIGANGAGKTRFAEAMAHNMGDKAFRLSAMRAIFDHTSEDPSPTSIDSLYHAAVENSPLIRPDIRGAFSRLMALIVNDTALDLLSRRLEGTPPASGSLEQLIEGWRRIFPDNNILLTRGRLLVKGEGDAYPAARMSAGEKTVLFYLGAVTMAPPEAMVLIDSPEMFLHPSTVRPLWDMVESLRPDCTFVYVTHDLGFAAARGGDLLWVKACDTEHGTWQYEQIKSAEGLPDDVYLAILGERKPVLFIEGDSRHSYDARLYPAVFPECTVKPLGSCERVIEATRSFNAVQSFHNLAARGIVDRDRRTDSEVAYLRRRGVMVPDVAEIENLFLLEDVVKTVAGANGRDPDKTFGRVRRNLLSLFRANIEQQAMEHTRHRIKREIQTRVDGRFGNIRAMEQHLDGLMNLVNPRGIYQEFRKEFESIAAAQDYRAVLRKFNFKPMITQTRVASITGSGNDDRHTYPERVLHLLGRGGSPESERIRAAIRRAFGL